MSTTTFAVTALVIALPWAYSLRRSSLSWSTFVSVLLLAHSLVGLHSLFLRSPPNIFKALNVPLNTPTDVIRALLLRYSDTPELDAEMDGLLQRLTSFEARTMYPRFGHNVIATCSYCHSFEDFAFYFLPRPMISYIREVAFIGLITANRRRAAVTGLISMFLLEVYILATVDIIIAPAGSPQPSLTIWWHDVILTVRHTLFILVPLAVHYAPPLRIPFISRPAPPSIDTSTLLVQIHQTMTHLLPSLHLLKYGQAATMRVPELRAHASGWWEEEARVGAWIREDGTEGSEAGSRSTSVRSIAKALGTSFDEAREGVEEGKLRTSAKAMTKIIMIDGLKPSPHWQPQES